MIHLKRVWWGFVGYVCLGILVIASPFLYLFMIAVVSLDDLERQQ